MNIWDYLAFDFDDDSDKVEEVLDNTPAIDEIKIPKFNFFEERLPIEAYQALYTLAIAIIEDCDGMSSKLGLEEPEETDIERAILLKSAIDTLTDLPCMDSVASALSTPHRHEIQEKVRKVMERAEEKGLL